ncbi:VCBS domain-containing protein, partial [Thiotrichales bacterium 19S3-7]|nr:VCBS domain-containing protein [Thiotrichales bacterium 19S3-7]
MAKVTDVIQGKEYLDMKFTSMSSNTNEGHENTHLGSESLLSKHARGTLLSDITVGDFIRKSFSLTDNDISLLVDIGLDVTNFNAVLPELETPQIYTNSLNSATPLTYTGIVELSNQVDRAPNPIESNQNLNPTTELAQPSAFTDNLSENTIDGTQVNQLSISSNTNNEIAEENLSTTTPIDTDTNTESIVSSESFGSVTEDESSPLTTSGTIIIPGSDNINFDPEAISSLYGNLQIDKDGNWLYSADNNQTAIQELGNSDTLTDTVTVTSADGSEHTISITVTGTNDAPIANADTATTSENVNLTIDALANDTDLDTSDSL